jgi:hypothetical protein
VIEDVLDREMPPVTLKPSTTSSLDLDTVRTTRRDEDPLLGRVDSGGRRRPVRVAAASPLLRAGSASRTAETTDAPLRRRLESARLQGGKKAAGAAKGRDYMSFQAAAGRSRTL